MEILDAFKEVGFSGVWLSVPLALLGIFAFIRWFFSDNSTWATPFELRHRAKLKVIEERIKSETDQLLVKILENQRQTLVFRESTGIIESNSTRRRQLIELHALSTNRFGWKAIKLAQSRLRFDESGIIKKGISKLNWISMSFSLTFVISLFVLAIYFGIFVDKPSGISVQEKLIFSIYQIIVEAVFMGIGMTIFMFTLPNIRALQLQKFIP